MQIKDMYLILKTIITLLLILLPAIVLYRDWKFYDRRTLRYRQITRAILSLWCISGLCSAIFVWIDTHQISQLSTKMTNLLKQNEELIEGKNFIILQNKELKERIEIYQFESHRMKESLLKEKIKTFDLLQPNESYGGLKIGSRKGSINRRYNDALDKYKNEKVIEAKEELELILEISPDESDSLNLLGIILNQLGNPEEGISCLKKAYDLSQDASILQNIKIIEENPGEKIEIIEIKN